jgi:hypothetical protein
MQSITVEGKSFVLVPADEYKKLRELANLSEMSLFSTAHCVKQPTDSQTPVKLPTESFSEWATRYVSWAFKDWETPEEMVRRLR